MAEKTKKKAKAKASANGKAPKKREAKPKQPYLPGAEDMAPPSIPELDEAAEDYRVARNSRMEMTQTEVDCAGKVLTLMHEHKLSEYEYNGHLLRINTLEKVSLKKQKSKDAETANGDE